MYIPQDSPRIYTPQVSQPYTLLKTPPEDILLKSRSHVHSSGLPLNIHSSGLPAIYIPQDAPRIYNPQIYHPYKLLKKSIKYTLLRSPRFSTWSTVDCTSDPLLGI
jgi:hypothetical protein